jgi:hypothetical protein
MYRLIARPAVAFVLAAGALAVLPGLWLGLGLAAAAALTLWKFSGCPHPRPLSLLPPIGGPGEERLPARWFCERCGQTWAASLDRLHPPIQRFHGYDATKAPQAAKRAAALEHRRRELAIQRGGMKKPAALPPSATVTAAAARPSRIKEPVPIRRVAG